MFVPDVCTSLACAAEEALVSLDTGYPWDNEQDSSHTDAQDDTHSSDIERTIASAFLSCMSYSDAIIAGKMQRLFSPVQRDAILPGSDDVPPFSLGIARRN